MPSRPPTRGGRDAPQLKPRRSLRLLTALAVGGSLRELDEQLARLLRERAIVVRKSQRVPVRSLKVGQRLTGIIRQISSLGIFLDVGAQRDGLVPISLISADYVADIFEDYMVGQKVTAWVAEVKSNSGELSLSLISPLARKNRFGPGVQDVSDFLGVSQEEWRSGTLTRIAEHGLLVELPCRAGRVVGLVKRAEMLEGQLQVDQELRVRVLQVDVEKGDLALSMRPVEGSRKRKWLQGTVQETTSSGAFIHLDQTTALKQDRVFVHVSLMAKDAIEDPAQVVEVGQRVEVRLFKDVGGKVMASMT